MSHCAGTAARPAVFHATGRHRSALHCQAAKGDRGSGGRGGGSSRGGGGGGSSRSGGGGGSKRSGSKQKQQRSAPPSGNPPGKQKQREQLQQQALVPPLRTQVLGELSTSDRMPEPLWSTFCGVTNGLWCGITSAHSPFTGVTRSCWVRSLAEMEGRHIHGRCCRSATRRAGVCFNNLRCSCAHTLWQPAHHPPGCHLASTPAGQAEPLALDAAGKPRTLLHQCCVEQRAAGEDGADSVVRCVGFDAFL